MSVRANQKRNVRYNVLRISNNSFNPKKKIERILHLTFYFIRRCKSSAFTLFSSNTYLFSVIIIKFSKIHL